MLHSVEEEFKVCWQASSELMLRRAAKPLLTAWYGSQNYFYDIRLTTVLTPRASKLQEVLRFDVHMSLWGRLQHREDVMGYTKTSPCCVTCSPHQFRWVERLYVNRVVVNIYLTGRTVDNLNAKFYHFVTEPIHLSTMLNISNIVICWGGYPPKKAEYIFLLK